MKTKSNQNAERTARGIEHLQRLKREHPNIVNIDATVRDVLLPRLDALTDPQVTFAELEDVFLAAAEAGEITFRATNGKFKSAGRCSAAEWLELLTLNKPLTAAEKERRMTSAEYLAAHPEAGEKIITQREVDTIRRLAKTALESNPDVDLEGVAGRQNLRRLVDEVQGPVTVQSVHAAIARLRAGRKLMLVPSARVEGSITTYVEGGGHPDRITTALALDGSEKDALRREIAAMSAEQLRARLNVDPAFAESVNNL